MKKVLALAFAFGGLTCAGNAIALTITLDDGYNGSAEVTIVDGSAEDTNSLTGVVSYLGNVNNWELNTTIGVSYPSLGTATLPQLDLFSLSLDYYNPFNDGFNFNTGGTIAITASDTYATFGELDAGINGFIASVGGTTAGEVELVADINGVVLDIDWDDMVKTACGFAGSTGMNLADYGFADDDVWDMSLTAIVTQGTGITTLDANIAPIPEPATMLLMGTGLIGLASIHRRKKAKKS